MSKLANDENVKMKVIVKICNTLNCKIDDIVDVIADEKGANSNG